MFIICKGRGGELAALRLKHQVGFNNDYGVIVININSSKIRAQKPIPLICDFNMWENDVVMWFCIYFSVKFSTYCLSLVTYNL